MELSSSRAIRLSRRYQALALLALLTAPSVAGVSFGSFTAENEKQVSSLKTNFSLEVFNYGGRALEVRLVPGESSEYNVTVPGEVNIQPVSTENPSGDGWYYLGNGEYTRTRELEFRVTASEHRSSNSLRVPVSVRASTPGGGGAETGTDVVYVQEHLFRMDIEGIMPEEEKAGEKWEYRERENSEPEVSGDPVDDRGPDVEVSRNVSVNSGDGETGGKKGGPTALQLAMLAGIALVSIYIFRLL